MHEPPSTTDITDIKKPSGYPVLSVRDSRSTAPVVFGNLRGAGSGSSRGSLIYYLCSNLFNGCPSNLDIVT